MSEVSRKENTSYGILFAVLAALAFAVMSVVVKEVGKAVPITMMLFFRYGISLILLIPWFMLTSNFSLKVKNPWRYAIQIAAALTSLFCIFYAIKFIPLVDILLLNITAIFFAPFVALVSTGNKIPVKTFVGVLVGFAGIGFILNSQHKILASASLIALASGVLTAISLMEMRLFDKTHPTKQLLFYYYLVSTSITGAAALFEWHTPESFKIWMLLLSIGVTGTCYQGFLMLCYALAPARITTPLMFLVVIFAGCFDWLGWGAVPSISTLIGGFCVLIGIIITVYFIQKKKVTKKNIKKRK